MCCVHVHIPHVGCMLYLCFVCIIYVMHVLGMPRMYYVCPACVCVCLLVSACVCVCLRVSACVCVCLRVSACLRMMLI